MIAPATRQAFRRRTSPPQREHRWSWIVRAHRKHLVLVFFISTERPDRNLQAWAKLHFLRSWHSM